MATSSATPAPSPTPTPQPTRSTLQALEAADLPVNDPVELVQRLGRVAGPVPRVVNATPPSYAVGDQASFWVSDDTQTSPIHFAVTATLRYITPHVYMWVEDGYTITEGDLRLSAERFEQKTYPTNRAFFGSEWTPGVDDDPHISIFNGRVPGVAGYFYSPNEYSHLVNPYSNEHEMFYINVSEDHRPGSDAYNYTLAHEFQHMIHWNNDRNEEAWVNEGLSVLAVALNGAPNSGYLRAFFPRAPDTQLTTWAVQAEDPSPHYGAGYLFVTYFLDRFGADALKSVVHSELNGRASFDAILAQSGESVRFDDVFADWVIANYLDDRALGAGRYGYQELRLDSPTLAARYEQYPVSITDTVHQYGADYIMLAGDHPTPLAIRFAGDTETRLADLAPHSGRWTWWSNRGDQVDCTLTRGFDLRGVQSATLSAWMWYDIEKDWDYGYVAVSTAGGQKWDILDGPATVRDNPNGNSLGAAYTGASGGGAEPAWIEQRIDLSRYAGQQILLRFELVTDDAVNQAGLFLDDVAIPEIGYTDDMEAGDGGWVAAGFVRDDNRLPQRYLVQVIQYDAGRPVVRRMELDDQQRGALQIGGVGPELGPAVLVVSALAPTTTEVAGYRVVVEP